jgi:hypothetical protein
MGIKSPDCSPRLIPKPAGFMDVASKLSVVETDTPPHGLLLENAKVKKRRKIILFNIIVVLFIVI